MSQDVPADKLEQAKYGLGQWLKVTGAVVAIAFVGFIVWFSFLDPANVQSSQSMDRSEYCQEVSLKRALIGGSEEHKERREHLENEVRKCWEDSMKALSDSFLIFMMLAEVSANDINCSVAVGATVDELLVWIAVAKLFKSDLKFAPD